MKKKVAVVTVAQAEEAARLADLPLEATVALAEVAGAIKDGLLAFASATGLVVMFQMMQAELTAKIGPKHARMPAAERVGNWHGTTQGPVVLGGRTVTTDRPRGRTTDGAEIELDTWKVFSSEDLLRQLVVERMLAGVATRRHADVAEPVGDGVQSRSKSMSKSAVSRRFVAATKTAMAELLARSLADLDIAALMIDGLDVAGQCVVVALVITTDGTKIPVGLWLGDTENKTVVTALLADLVARGLDVTSGVLCVIDGAKALAAGIRKVFGEHAVVQRCTIHKRRNVTGHLPKELAGTIDRRLAMIFARPDATKGLTAARTLAKELEADHPDAAASLREGLDDMFTVRRLGIGGTLAKTLTNTNCIESMISIARRTTGRVTKWKDGSMKKRWIAAGMLEAERSFRRVRGYKDMSKLVAALRSEVTSRTVTPTEYDQAAA
ncbi:MAG: IS256 family transposase [Actinomycetota bacterium]|jgi:transposase-like protein|nr:IS256 family transposase [Actinomycetota bacterium]